MKTRGGLGTKGHWYSDVAGCKRPYNGMGDKKLRGETLGCVVGRSDRIQKWPEVVELGMHRVASRRVR